MIREKCEPVMSPELWAGAFLAERVLYIWNKVFQRSRLAAWKARLKQMREKTLPCAARFSGDPRNQGVLLSKSARTEPAPSSSASPVSLAAAAILSAVCIGPFFFSPWSPGHSKMTPEPQPSSGGSGWRGVGPEVGREGVISCGQRNLCICAV